MRNFNTSLVTFKQIKHTETDNKILVEGILDKPQAKLTEKKSGPNCGVGSHSCHPFCKSAIVKEVKHTDVLILNQFVDSKGEMYSQEDLGICMVGCQSLDINSGPKPPPCRDSGPGSTSWSRCARGPASCRVRSSTVRSTGRPSGAVRTATGTRRLLTFSGTTTNSDRREKNLPRGTLKNINQSNIFRR